MLKTPFSTLSKSVKTETTANRLSLEDTSICPLCNKKMVIKNVGPEKIQAWTCMIHAVVMPVKD